MIKNRMLFLIAMLVLSASPTVASTLDKQIEAFFHAQWGEKASDIQVSYPQNKPQLDCEEPILNLVNPQKKWGNVTISAECHHKKTFIQVYIAIVGNYIVANQSIAAGSVITQDSIRLQSGRLDKLPPGILLDKTELIDFVALRNITHEQPIKSTMIRKRWQVKAGQVVKLILNGDGYQIITQGKPLTNAGLGDMINVRTENGKVVKGVVTNQGITISDKKN